MAYPTIDKPYGLKPINLIGGAPFAGATIQLPIQYGEPTAIYYGDIVKYAAGTIVRSVLDYNDAAYDPGTVGVFLGVTYTNPSTGQKIWTQTWPTGLVVNDAEAIVADDPDTLFQVVAVANSGSNVSTTVAALGQTFVGTNCFPVTGNTANTLSGVSATGVCVDASNARITTTAPFRIVALNPATLITTNAVIAATATNAAQTITAANSNIRVGMNITGTGVTAGTTVVSVSGTTVTASASITGVAGNTLNFVGAPEVIVKFNFGYHSYYNAAGV